MTHLLQDGGEEHGKGGVGDVGQEEDGCRCPWDGIAEHGTGTLAEANEKARGGGPYLLLCVDTLTFVVNLVLITRRKQTILCNLLLPGCQIGGTVW